jgi:hypothetical protein
MAAAATYIPLCQAAAGTVTTIIGVATCASQVSPPPDIQTRVRGYFKTPDYRKYESRYGSAVRQDSTIRESQTVKHMLTIQRQGSTIHQHSLAVQAHVVGSDGSGFCDNHIKTSTYADREEPTE